MHQMIEELVARLDGIPSGKGYKAFCPAHTDHSRSLSFKDENGTLLVHCFAGCTQQEVIDALQELGLWTGKTSQFSTILSVHDYFDEQRVLLYQQIRFDPKAFRPRRPDP